MQDQNQAVRRSNRERKIPSNLEDYVYKLPPSNLIEHDEVTPSFSAYKLNNTSHYSPDYVISFHNVMKVSEPTSYNEAASQEGWKTTMEEEIQALELNETWEFIDLPKDKKALDSKWVYRVKSDKDGNVVRLKARLVARGDRQVKRERL